MVGVDCMIYLEYQFDLTMSYFFQVMSYEVVEGVAEVARVKQEVVQEVVQGAEGVRGQVSFSIRIFKLCTMF